MLRIVHEFLLPSSNPQELHKQDFGTESLPGILEKGKGALHIFSVSLYFFFFFKSHLTQCKEGGGINKKKERNHHFTACYPSAVFGGNRKPGCFSRLPPLLKPAGAAPLPSGAQRPLRAAGGRSLPRHSRGFLSNVLLRSFTSSGLPTLS